jgi:hypothetical protein
MLVASAIALAVIGAAAAVAERAGRVHSYEMEDASAHQEATVLLDRVVRLITSAGSDPYAADTGGCGDGGPVVAITPDPNGDGKHDDVRVQADVNPPNGLLVGTTGLCAETGEDVTIRHDAPSRTAAVRDAAGGTWLPLTDGVVEELEFSFLRRDRTPTFDPAVIESVQLRVVVRSRSRNLFTGAHATFTHRAEIRLRRQR